MRLVNSRADHRSLAGPTPALLGLVGRLLFPVTFVLADSTALLVAATVSHWLPGTAEDSGSQGFLPGVRFAYPLAFWLTSLVCLTAFGFYNRLRTAFRRGELIELYRILAIGVVVTMAVTLALTGKAAPPVAYIASWAMAPPALGAARASARWLRRQIVPASTLAVPVLILGEAETVDRLRRHVESVPELDLAPIIMGDGEHPTETPFTAGAIAGIAQEHGVTHLVVAPQAHDEGRSLETAMYCQQAGLRVYWLQPAAGPPLRVSSLHLWEGAPVIQVVGPRARQSYDWAKRVLDLLGSAALIVALLPLLTVIGLAVKLDSPGPALIRQMRIGRDRRPFHMYKFRSMRIGSEDIPEDLKRQNEATGPMFKIRRDPRITRVGRILRRTSLDELPQLFNVLFGQMSLVGPRPPLPREIPGYEEVQGKRLTVTPGITGLWQVSGRSNLTFEQMLSLDLEYIEKRSLALDLLILARTLPCAVKGAGAC